MTFLTAPKGAPDIVPPRSALFEHVADVASKLFRLYGYRRIETPSFEHTELFMRGLQTESEIVTKEMYTFEDKGGRSLTLRPDMTAPVVRAILENRLELQGLPIKLYYVSSVFRHEKPQAGRNRQFWQVGVEAVGSDSFDLDAEVIALAAATFHKLGLPVKMALNSVGHPECKAAYMPKLMEFLSANRDRMCDDCKVRIDRNPLRTFDCKVPADKQIMKAAPVLIDHLCDDCARHHEGLKGRLDLMGVEYIDDPLLVRGLDYYTRTAFEFTAQGLGAQDAVGGGGRYDGLAEALGGKHLPGIGFGLGIDRIVMGLGDADIKRLLDVFLVRLGEEAKTRGIEVAALLRREGFSVDVDFDDRSVKAQFKAADRSGARAAVIIGQKELEEGKFTVKDMQTGDETTVAVGGLVDHLKGVL